MDCWAGLEDDISQLSAFYKAGVIADPPPDKCFFLSAQIISNPKHNGKALAQDFREDIWSTREY